MFIMCVRKDIGELPPFYFNVERMPSCNIDDILLDDKDIPDLQKYQLKPEMIEWIDNWNEFLQGIKCDKLPGFPIWADSLCAIEDNPMIDQWDEMPSWMKNFIKKNSELWASNKEFIEKWLEKAKRNRLFFGAKAKLEWQAGETKYPDVWQNIMQIRPSGLRVKPGTYFPALVAITQTSIVGKRKRYLTPRECARLQCFPDSFICNDKNPQAYKQFGNSINVALVKLFAQYMFGVQEVQKKYSYEAQFGKEIKPSLFPDY